MNDLAVDLERVGDDLQRAIRIDHRRRLKRRAQLPARGVLLVAVAGALLLAVVGGSVAATLWPSPSPSAESTGLVASDAVFAGSHPRCNPVSDGAFTCTLTSAPAGLTVAGSYVGTKVSTVDDHSRVNGGCVATSSDGHSWDCYIGQRAVDRNIVDQSLLGTTKTSITHG
ncbi:MAG TPA: hypothetical protein VGO31_10440 [Microbacteriaceae bacterium]|jgi:hypothetical protein|nr:hypothetical protein [Microbacteriaceae bacterium]